MLTIKHITEVSLSAKDFFDFLKRNNAFEVYKCNIINNYRKNLKPNVELISNFNKFFNNFSEVQCWIAGAFSWSSTAQGFEYWKKLDIEWCEHFRDCNKINLTPISEEDLKKYFRDSITGKWYKVTDNSYNRSADNDPNCVWKNINISHLGWKDLKGKEYLILEEPCCVTIDLSIVYYGDMELLTTCRNSHHEMIKVWVPEYNCAQWVLFNPKNVCENTK